MNTAQPLDHVALPPSEWVPYARKIHALSGAPATMPGVCFGCGQPLTDLRDACLIFIDPATGREDAGPRLPRIGHVMCAAGPYVGAAIDLLDLYYEGAEGEWVAYIRKQSWWRDWFIGDVWVAFRIAQALWDAEGSAVLGRADDDDEPDEEPEPAPMRSVAESIPRRRPKASPNPRSITVTMRSRVLERDGFRCRRCGHGPDVAPLVIDHIVAVAKGGTGEFDNLQTLCWPCNAGKSDRDPHAHDLNSGSR